MQGTRVSARSDGGVRTSSGGGSRDHGRGGGKAKAGGRLSAEARVGLRVGWSHRRIRIPFLALEAFVLEGETLGALC